jgi:hypothetical protein
VTCAPSAIARQRLGHFAESTLRRLTPADVRHPLEREPRAGLLVRAEEQERQRRTLMVRWSAPTLKRALSSVIRAA